MIPELEELVSLYERGGIPRRSFLGALVALTSATASRAASPRATSRTSTSACATCKESERFYRELFGLPPVREVAGAAYALNLSGGGFISLCPIGNHDRGMSDSPAPGEIDHFGPGVDNFRPGTTASQRPHPPFRRSVPPARPLPPWRSL